MALTLNDLEELRKYVYERRRNPETGEIEMWLVNPEKPIKYWDDDSVDGD